ncbi:MAG: hypothetical protein FWE07_01180 [Turicibacter sp.]|nr:hypothetical protein [Turicibacter sp.]
MAQLTKESKFLLAVGILATAAMIVAGTFVNVFLIRATEGNLGLLVVQNIINSITLLIAFVGGSKLLAKIAITTLLKIGIASMAFYFIAILILQDNVATFLIPLALFNGLGGGLYWFATNLLIAKVIKESEQGRYFGFQQTAGSIFGVITPAISGFIITRFTDLTGYYILFGISFVLFALAAIMIRNIPGFTSQTKIHVYDVLKLKGNRYWNACKLFTFTNALKDIINGQIFMLFAFLIFVNEGVMGNILSATALITVFSSFWFAKISKRENQQPFYLVTAVIMTAMYILLAIFPTVPVLIAALVIFAVIQNWAGTILQSVIFQLTSRAKGDYEQNDYLVALEFPTALGRVLGMAVALVLIHLITADMYVYRILFVVIAIAWVLEYIIIEKQVKWFRDELQEEKTFD